MAQVRQKLCAVNGCNSLNCFDLDDKYIGYDEVHSVPYFGELDSFVNDRTGNLRLHPNAVRSQLMHQASNVSTLEQPGA